MPTSGEPGAAYSCGPALARRRHCCDILTSFRNPRRQPRHDEHRLGLDHPPGCQHPPPRQLQPGRIPFSHGSSAGLSPSGDSGTRVLLLSDSDAGPGCAESCGLPTGSMVFSTQRISTRIYRCMHRTIGRRAWKSPWRRSSLRWRPWSCTWWRDSETLDHCILRHRARRSRLPPQCGRPPAGRFGSMVRQPCSSPLHCIC